MSRRKEGMIEMIDKYIEYYYLVPVSSLLILVITYAINYWDATTLENQLMANFKKLQIFSSTILLESIVISAILYILLFLNQDPLEELYQVKNFETTHVMILLVNLFIIGIIISLGLNLILIIIKKIIEVKYHFFTFLPNMEGKWYLLRKSTKNRILLMDEKGRFLFHEDWNGLIFEREIFPLNKLQLFLYGTKRRYFNTILTSILSLIVLSIFYYSVDLELKHRYIILFSSIIVVAIASITFRSIRLLLSSAS
ncbi:MAG: hypothetical protein M3Z79_05270 [Lysinibacillus fusiformis]|nr:hypothetical protein [Lysinibacillus fusiformis]